MQPLNMKPAEEWQSDPITVCPGETFVAEHCDSFAGDISFQLKDAHSNTISKNVDVSGVEGCAKVVYSVPRNEDCQDFSLWKKCHSEDDHCGGKTMYEVIPHHSSSSYVSTKKAEAYLTIRRDASRLKTQPSGAEIPLNKCLSLDIDPHMHYLFTCETSAGDSLWSYERFHNGECQQSSVVGRKTFSSAGESVHFSEGFSLSLHCNGGAIPTTNNVYVPYVSRSLSASSLITLPLYGSAIALMLIVVLFALGVKAAMGFRLVSSINSETDKAADSCIALVV